MSSIFDSIFTSSSDSIAVWQFLAVVAVAIVLGVAFACVYCVKNSHSKSIFVALSVLPVVVCVVILMVNGNLGAGVAVAGAFSLVRFRSAQGNAKEICAVFIAMGIGLICGMGYVAYAALFTVIAGAFMFAPNRFVARRGNGRILTVVIPESLNYDEVFDDVFAKYLDECKLNFVKTTDMGSLYKLSYAVSLKKTASEKEFLDELRTRNGNLEVCLKSAELVPNEL